MKCARENCKSHAIRGGTVCRVHGGSAPQVRKAAAVRAELMRWTAGDPVDDPGETLLRLITQSRMRADLYAGLLEKAYDAAERLKNADDAGNAHLGEDARRDLDEVLHTGGVSVLVGKTYGAAGKEGHIYATGEAIRGLARLEAEERDRCANFCRLAIAAGIAERQVRVAERLAGILQDVLVGALDDAGLSPEQRRAVMAGAGHRLRSVAQAG